MSTPANGFGNKLGRITAINCNNIAGFQSAQGRVEIVNASILEKIAGIHISRRRRDYINVRVEKQVARLRRTRRERVKEEVMAGDFLPCRRVSPDINSNRTRQNNILLFVKSVQIGVLEIVFANSVGRRRGKEWHGEINKKMPRPSAEPPVTAPPTIVAWAGTTARLRNAAVIKPATKENI